MGNRPQMPHLTSAFSLRDGDRNRCLVDIQPDEPAVLHVVSPPFPRPGASQSGETLERRMPRERPPAQSTQDAIMGSKGYATPVGIPTR
jgi:hypothetical protein